MSKAQETSPKRVLTINLDGREFRIEAEPEASWQSLVDMTLADLAARGYHKPSPRRELEAAGLWPN